MSKGGENKPERGALAEYLILNLETTQKTQSAAPENQRRRELEKYSVGLPNGNTFI